MALLQGLPVRPFILSRPGVNAAGTRFTSMAPQSYQLIVALDLRETQDGWMRRYFLENSGYTW
jgi:hypothetical protein